MHRRWRAFVDGRPRTATTSGVTCPASTAPAACPPTCAGASCTRAQLLADLAPSTAHDTFASELAWRDFYADVLFHRPESAWQNLQPTDGRDAGRHRRCAHGGGSTAWATGRTGFPIVDAGMRQLLATGWMHNRVRMITASFLVKDLHLPWQWGARHFMHHLVDGDLASNNHGWQWAAGTGTDAAPYFRVFNPTAQAERFDPDGEYVRDGCRAAISPRLGTTSATYPAPMVDHAVERVEALAGTSDQQLVAG